MFIKLTGNANSYKGESILVNANNILGILRGGEDYTMIIFDNSNLIVKETPEEILNKIKECEK